MSKCLLLLSYRKILFKLKIIITYYTLYKNIINKYMLKKKTVYIKIKVLK
jgi:hypothetical protein